jgi:hypothetical protein
MGQKLVFFDIDGTLKPYGKPVPEPTKLALRLLREQGHLPVVCTGRTYASAMANSWLRELDFPVVICAAGGQVVVEGKTIYLHTLPAGEGERLASLFAQYGCQFAMESPEGIFYSSPQALTLWRRVLGEEVPMFPLQGEPEGVQKAIAKGVSALRAAPEYAQLEEDYQLLWYGEEADLLEVIPRGTGKVAGIRALLAHTGFRQEDTVAFGDGPNDVEMLAFCGCGVAMGDGQPMAKAAADYVTGPCDGSGIYDACRRLGLI